jgi:uncharacterized membrane protein YfbV (UPF0208 family)
MDKSNQNQFVVQFTNASHYSEYSPTSTQCLYCFSAHHVRNAKTFAGGASMPKLVVSSLVHRLWFEEMHLALVDL